MVLVCRINQRKDVEQKPDLNECPNRPYEDCTGVRQEKKPLSLFNLLRFLYVMHRLFRYIRMKEGDCHDHLLPVDQSGLDYCACFCRVDAHGTRGQGFRACCARTGAAYSDGFGHQSGNQGSRAGRQGGSERSCTGKRRPMGSARTCGHHGACSERLGTHCRRGPSHLQRKARGSRQE